MPKILELKNVSKKYQTKQGETLALENINFNVDEGEFLSIIGPSGCGKSTLLSIIAGLEPKSSGEIYIENEKVENATFDLRGKIIYFIIELNSGTTEDAQSLAIKFLEELSQDEKEFYDINFTITNSADTDEAKLFPIMGYKKSDATLISWIKQTERK